VVEVKRRRLTALLALLIAWGGLPPAADAALADRAISWTVNHRAKTITIKAKLQFYFTPCYTMAWTPGGVAVPTGLDCSMSEAEIAQEIKDDIEGVWNKGHRYRCYLLIVIVAVSVTRDRFTVDDDKIGVRVDRGSNIRSHVHREVSSGVGSWDSNDPSSRSEPTNSSWLPTEFGHPRLNRHSYAHEFGHILGLDDHYDRIFGGIRPGAADDVMSRSANGRIDQSTIDRVVERNRDRLRDTRGNPVDLDDLVCEHMFRVTFTGGERYYGAVHLMDSLLRSPCSPAPFSASTDQDLSVDSQAVDVALIEQQGIAPGYAFLPMPDPMTAFGLSAVQVASLRASLIDLPITVGVRRFRTQPATGRLPAVLDLQSGVCTGGSPDGGSNQPDCGRREYRAWLAIKLTGPNQVSPTDAGLPPVLAALGSPLRLDRLYRSCTGPTPFPGAIASALTAVSTSDPLPDYEELVNISLGWRSEGRPGKKEINGQVTVARDEPGTLVDASYGWTLTICPLNGDGEAPPNCS
jgi:hypothetical protein